jgi:hypothetical protein
MHEYLVRPTLALVLLLGSSFQAATGRLSQRDSAVRFEISFPARVRQEPVDGRLLLLLSRNTSGEPRFTAANWANPQPMWGMDVEGLQAGQPAVIDSRVPGYPVESIADVPAGEYTIQAVLNVYTTFRRSDGHVVKLHMDQWEGQQWNRSPGNLYSRPAKIKIDPARAATIRLSLDEKIAPIDPPKDTRFVKHVKIRSEVVSRFWGRDMYIGAVVLLPKGFDEHPEARYPVVYVQNHFTPTLRGFGEDLSEPSAPDRRGRAGFYQGWTADGFPRFLLVIPQEPNPFYDDSYAVNSVNVGPYGDAITKELMPYVEKKFRAIGEPWSRTLTGGSTGGWRTLAVQILYPDLFNGAWAFCPDPVDFRYFQLVNIYEDENAYYPRSEWKKDPIRPWMRNVDDQVLVTVKEASTLELVLGTRGRSGEQMDIFQAVFGPVGSDGYPRLLYDKRTGVIDKEVAAYWKEHFDLRYIMDRDWPALGPKLKGKLRIYIGDTDTFYLEEATQLLESFLRATKDPYFDGSVEYGKRAPHCWSGVPPGANPYIYYIPAMADHITRTAPAGADVKSWRY